MRKIECKPRTTRVSRYRRFRLPLEEQRWGGKPMSQKRAATAAGAVSRLAVAVIVALGAPQTVLYAQEPANPSLQDEVIVTGSRLRTSGMDMPNPVTVVTRAEVSVIAPTNLIEGVAELPQFYGSNTTQNPGNFFVT